MIDVSAQYLHSTLFDTASTTAETSPALDHVLIGSLVKLKALGPARIKDMKAAGISKQIVSHLPFDISLRLCKTVNNALHQMIRFGPDQYRGLALLPAAMNSVSGVEVAKELERAVTEYQFVGGVLVIKNDDATGIHAGMGWDNV